MSRRPFLAALALGWFVLSGGPASADGRVVVVAQDGSGAYR